MGQTVFDNNLGYGLSTVSNEQAVSTIGAIPDVGQDNSSEYAAGVQKILSNPNYTGIDQSTGILPIGTYNPATNQYEAPYTESNNTAANGSSATGYAAVEAAAATDAVDGGDAATGTALLQLGTTLANSEKASVNAQAANDNTWAGYFLRAVIIVLGFIFVGVGLSMFKNGSGASEAFDRVVGGKVNRAYDKVPKFNNTEKQMVHTAGHAQKAATVAQIAMG